MSLSSTNLNLKLSSIFTPTKKLIMASKSVVFPLPVYPITIIVLQFKSSYLEGI
jgi:hypothetical protein